MSENVSSSVLFHFTNSVDHLKGILRDGFFPRYCPEYSVDPVDRNEARQGRAPLRAAPVVCFCDLPLSLIRKHLKKYGNFGIGLNKKWGIRNGLAPVIYTHSKAQTRPTLLRLPNMAEQDGTTAARDMLFLASYTKPFQGPAWRGKKIHKRVRFYDEREWRYVPIAPAGESLFLERKDYNNTSKKNALHRHFKQHHALRIHPDDIQYLIVPYDKSEKNILELYNYVMKRYARRYSRDDAKLVSTTIMTVDRIHKDV